MYLLYFAMSTTNLFFIYYHLIDYFEYVVLNGFIPFINQINKFKNKKRYILVEILSDIPDLIPIDFETDSDIPDLIDASDTDSDMPDLIQVDSDSDSDSDMHNLISAAQYSQRSIDGVEGDHNDILIEHVQ
jgi:hypothetical protein